MLETLKGSILTMITLKNFLVLFIVGSIFLWHIVAVSLVAGPDFPNSEQFKGYANSYLQKVFNQHWAFFAPEPPLTNNAFFYRCKFKGEDWNGWVDPGAILLKHHREQRLSYYGKLYVLFSEIGQGLSREAGNIDQELKCDKTKDLSCLKEFNSIISQTPEFHLAHRFTKDLCLKRKGVSDLSSLEKVEFKTIEAPIRDFDQRKIPESRSMADTAYFVSYPAVQVKP